MTQIDELVKRVEDALRFKYRWNGEGHSCASAFREGLVKLKEEGLALTLAAALEAQAARVKELEVAASDYEQVLDSKRQNTRELDIAMHGEDGAAQQASLCDLIEPARRMRARINTLEAQLEEFREALKPFADIAVYMSRNHLNNDDDAMVHVKLGDCNKADRALMSALRNAEGNKDGE